MKELSTRKRKEVLRPRFELGLGQRQIARSGSIGQPAVSECLKHAQAASLREGLTEMFTVNGWAGRPR